MKANRVTEKISDKNSLSRISLKLNPIKQDGLELLFKENSMVVLDATLGFFTD